MTGPEPVSPEAELLASLVARQQISDVLARYCECVDECDIDGLAEVFAPDCVTDYGPGRGGRLVGRRAVCDRLAAVLPTLRRTQHQLGQQRMEPQPDGSWLSTTYATAWHELPDGSTTVSRVRYLDRFVATPEGWRIAERRLVALGLEGWVGIEYPFLQRRAGEPS
jgi:3-phenylpropionate/cinnamic acid dioxygenase small subunit